MAYHVPVMVEEVVTGLATDPSGVYVDATAGGGGHAEALLRALGERGHLLVCDRDAAAVNEAGRRLDPYRGRVTFLQCAFSSLGRSVAPLLDRLERSGVEGVLFDLGVSSHQIDEPGRGFSYHQDGPLDMRMDRGAGEPADQLLARIREADLVELIRRNGEERQARRIARSICRSRDEGRMQTTAQLARAIESTRPERPTKTLARVFQALRIAVNDELTELEKGLRGAVDLLAPGGRLAVIAYHSLEDRIVKHRMGSLTRGCVCPPDLPVCACGRRPTFLRIGPARRPGAEEQAANSRSRSATLRLFEKVPCTSGGTGGAVR